MKTERISIRITEEKKQKFIEMANRSGMTLDEVLQQLKDIKQFLMTNYDQKEA